MLSLIYGFVGCLGRNLFGLWVCFMRCLCCITIWLWVDCIWVDWLFLGSGGWLAVRVSCWFGVRWWWVGFGFGRVLQDLVLGGCL